MLRSLDFFLRAMQKQRIVFIRRVTRSDVYLRKISPVSVYKADCTRTRIDLGN